jgi:hypothetical protein
MNNTIWAGLVLTVLGLSGVISTGAATAVIPAVFGLILIGLGAAMQRPARAAAASWTAAGVALLGLLAPIANLARVIGERGFVANAATFSNLAMAVICGAYLAVWVWERRARDRAPLR